MRRTCNASKLSSRYLARSVPGIGTMSAKHSLPRLYAVDGREPVLAGSEETSSTEAAQARRGNGESGLLLGGRTGRGLPGECGADRSPPFGPRVGTEPPRWTSR